jgi:hypothetical protein
MEEVQGGWETVYMKKDGKPADVVGISGIRSTKQY